MSTLPLPYSVLPLYCQVAGPFHQDRPLPCSLHDSPFVGEGLPEYLSAWGFDGQPFASHQQERDQKLFQQGAEFGDLSRALLEHPDEFTAFVMSKNVDRLTLLAKRLERPIEVAEVPCDLDPSGIYACIRVGKLADAGGPYLAYAHETIPAHTSAHEHDHRPGLLLNAGRSRNSGGQYGAQVHPRYIRADIELHNRTGREVPGGSYCEVRPGEGGEWFVVGLMPALQGNPS